MKLMQSYLRIVNTLVKLNSMRALDKACGVKVEETICKFYCIGDLIYAL
jgi:hypothetical protein